MFSPDREPHPAVSEIKYLQQPVTFSFDRDVEVPIDGNSASVVLRAQNRYTFRDLSHLNWSWHLMSNRSTDPIHSGFFELPSRHDAHDIVIILDGAVGKVHDLEKSRPKNGNTYFLNIRGFLATEESWASEGHLLVQEQFKVNFTFTKIVAHSAPSRVTEKAILRVQETKTQVLITASGAMFAIIDIQTGALIDYSPRLNNLLAGPARANFTRAATDNDRGGMELTLDFIFPFKVDKFFEKIWGTEDFSFYSHWKRAGLTESTPPTITCSNIRVTPGQDKVDVVGIYSVNNARNKAHIFQVTAHFGFFSDKRVCIAYHVAPQRALRDATSIPRVGLNMQLDESLNRIQYYGRGPHENYPDRKASAEFGVFKTTPEEMSYLKYIVPSENGSRSDCEWISFRTKNDEGLCLVCKDDDARDGNFSCSASLYSNSELDLATHTRDLPYRKQGAIHVNIDHRLMGLGGDNSWFPVVYPEFRIKPTQDYRFQVWLIPLTSEDDASVVALDRCCSG